MMRVSSRGDAGQLPPAVRDVAMRRAVKAVPPHLVPAIQLIRNRVQVGLLGHRVVERGIEHRDVRHVGA